MAATGVGRAWALIRPSGPALAGIEFSATSGSATMQLAPSGGGARPPLVNECATSRREWIWCDDFEQDRLRRYFEYDDASGNIVRAAGIGVEGSFGMRWGSPRANGGRCAAPAIGKSFRPGTRAPRGTGSCTGDCTSVTSRGGRRGLQLHQSDELCGAQLGARDGGASVGRRSARQELSPARPRFHH